MVSIKWGANALKAHIHHITRLRINSDGTGVRSVVFVHGCPLNCFWCCNPETRYTEDYKTLTTDELNKYIVRDKPYFVHSNGGVTFCGGEPLLYAEFIEQYIREYCADFSVSIETSLYAKREKIAQILPFIDEWYIDFKVYDEKRHISFTGKSNHAIKENIRFLAQNIRKEKIVITFPMIAGYNTSDVDIREMIAYLKDIGIHRVAPHPYRKEAEEKHRQLGIAPTSAHKVDSELYQSVIKKFVKNGFEIVEGEVLIEKQKCAYLKKIRKSLCTERNINLKIKNCDFEGRCTGTCPQCEYELDVINGYV